MKGPGVVFATTVAACVFILCNLAMAKSPQCETKNWNHGTLQTLAATLPAGSHTQEIIISVKNLDDNDYEGTCPNNPPDPPSLDNGPQRQCQPSKFGDMVTEWVHDKDEGDKHSVTIQIKNGDQAPPRTVKLCVKYTE